MRETNDSILSQRIKDQDKAANNQAKIEKFFKDKPFERILYSIHDSLMKRAAQTEKTITEDPHFLEIFCPDCETLCEKSNFQPEAKPRCDHCLQPHIDAHDFYYRCPNPQHVI